MEWFTVLETARVLGLAPDMIYQLCDAGHLTHHRDDPKKSRSRIRISQAAINSYLKSCEIPVDLGPIRRNGEKVSKRPFAGELESAHSKKECVTEWFKTAEAAKRLGLSIDTTRVLCSERKIAHWRIGLNQGLIRISQAAIDAYHESCEIPIEPEPIERKRGRRRQPPTETIDVVRTKNL